jgi:L-fuculose-phosphate aldolase
VVESLRGREAAIRKQAAAVLASNHGAFVAGANLFHAIDALERLDWNAWCILAQSLLPEQPVPYKPALA